jgi:aldose 1-epimerase
MPDFQGAVLAPWPNRLADGRYEFGGRIHQLPVSEPGRNTALHGLVSWQSWSAVGVDPDRVRLATTLWPQRGYPFTLTLEATYQLDPDGLSIEITAHSDTPAPFAVSMHPWFVVPGRSFGDWELTLPADTVLTVDDRLLPTGTRPVAAELDFRSGRAIGATRLDHTFTDIAFTDGRARATLSDGDGRGVAVGWDESCRWVQVCSGDEAGPDRNRRALAIEPMTAPADAFRSGTGLHRLGPDRPLTTRWTIAAVEPATDREPRTAPVPS